MSLPVSSSPQNASRNARTIAAKPAMAFGADSSRSLYTSMSTTLMGGATPVSNGNGEAVAPPPEPSGVRSFVPQQFSAATQMILKRLRGEGGFLGSNAAPTSPYQIGTVQHPGYEDVRRSVLEGMKTTLNMDMNTSPAPAKKIKAKNEKGVTSGTSTPIGTTPNSSAKAVPKVKSASKSARVRAGTKRKRAKEESDSAEDSSALSGLGGDSDSDGSGSITHFPTKTLSGRNVVKPAHFNPAAQEGPARKRGSHHFKRTGRNVEQALCKRCGRGHSPVSNMIVFCDGCNLGWHQMCHDPIISDEIVKDETTEWFCKDCSAKRGRGPKSKTPPESAPNTNWVGKTMEEKRAYLASMPHSHLVSILLQATTIHPDIAIPPPPPGTAQTQSSQFQPNPARRLNVYPQQPFPPSAAAQSGLFSRAEANPSAPINFIRKIHPSPPPGPSDSSQPATNSVLPSGTLEFASAQPAISQAPDELYQSRESTPASPPYPKPGNGLMAKLPPDDQDMEWLVGEGEDEAAFSHMVFDEHGGFEIVRESAAAKM